MTPTITTPLSTDATLFFAGGGTGGHLYPGIATAEALRAHLPGAKVVFLCTTRDIDRVILEPTGFEFIQQPIVPPKTSISGLLRFWKSWRETKDQIKSLLNDRRPAAVLGLGGYAAGAAVKMAAGRGIPTAILNPDVIPGKANQYLMKQTTAVCCQFGQTANHVSADRRSKLHVTGCPIRADLVKLPPRPDATGRLGIDPTLSTLVVTGASLGAKTVNDAVLGVMETTAFPGWQIIHLSGRDHAADVRRGYESVKTPAKVIDFTADMADVWSVADLVVSRSGASSCAELTACGLPSILFPYPYHKDMHQRANAKVLADAGAAMLIDDQKDKTKNAELLRPILQLLTTDESKRKSMAAAATGLGKPAAASAVAAVLATMV